MSSRRRYVDVSDILDAVEDENDSDACDLLGESDSDDDDYVIPVSLPEDDTGTENESDWDEEDNFPLQQLESTQPAKKQKKDKPTINYKWRKKLYDLQIQHLLVMYWKLQEIPLPLWITFTNLLTMICFRS